MNRFALVLVLAVSGVSRLVSQEEAPDYQLIPEGNQRLSRVEASGSWTARGALGWTGGWSDQGFVPSATYSDFSKGFVFTQVPDFSLGVRLLDRYFLRVVYTGSVEENSFELGYDGQDGEFLNWVRAGNTPFEVPARAGTFVPPGRTGNPAFGLGWRSDSAQGELVVRYEDNSRETRDFRGFTPLEGPRVDLTGWIRGRFFQLPGPGPWKNVRVQFENPDQPGGMSPAATSDYLADESTGTVDLARPAYRRVWASWDGQALSLVYDPGQPTGMERQDHYPLPEGVDSRSRAQITDTTTGAEISGYQISLDVLGGWVVIAPPVLPATAQNARRELRFLASSQGLAQWTLGSDVEASSLIVTVNGFGTRDWDFQAGNGVVVPRFSVADSDEVHMVFQRRQKSGRSADAFGWLGGSWQIFPGQSLEANTWVRWNSVKDRYTTQEAQAPGQVAGTLQWAGSAGPLTWSLRSEASARLADSTGTRHLLDWSAAAAGVALSSQSLRPAAAPRATLGSVSPRASNRGTTFFRDFAIIDPLTGASNIGAWQPGQNAEATGPGGLTGPYLVTGDEFVGERAAVLDSRLSTGQWTGLQVFLDEGRAQDLSSRSHLDLNLRFPDRLPSGLRVFFVAGALGENFDGSGEVKTISHGTRETIPFVDSLGQATLGFPVPEGTEWTNDGNSDGVATDGGIPLVVELTSELDGSRADWQVLGIELSESQRSLLGRSTSWGLIITSESALPIATALLVQTIAFGGASWDITSQQPGVSGSFISVKDEINPVEGNASVVTWKQNPEWSLEARFPAFQPSDYRLLTWNYELDLTNPAPKPGVTLRFLSGDVVGAEYVLTPQSGTSTLTIDLATGNLMNGAAEVIPTVWNPAVSSWDRVSWSSTMAPGGTLRLSPPAATDPVWVSGLATDAETKVSFWGQDLRLKARSRISSFSGPTWSALSDWSSRFGPLSGTWSAEWSPSGLTHSGYDAALVLALADPTLSLRVTDALSDRLARRVSSEVKLAFLGSASATESAVWVGNRLEQNFQATWTSWTPESTRPELKLTADGRMVDSGTVPSADWGTLWTDSLDWLVPALGAHESIGGHARAQISWNPGELGIDTAVDAMTLQLSGLPWTVTSTGSAFLSLPWIQSGTSPWIVTPRASVQYSSTWKPDTGYSVPELAQFAAKELMTHDGSAPDYRGDFGLKLELAHLPLQLVGEAGWSQGALSGQPYLLTTQSLKSQMRWDNLFGRSGQWPLMSWYRTDGLTLRFEGTLSQGTRSSDNSTELTNNWEPEVLLSSVERVAWPVGWLWKDKEGRSIAINTGPVWSWHGPAKLPVELPDWISSPVFDRQIQFETRSDLGVQWEESQGWSLQKWQVSEKISVTLSSRSEVHLDLRWGNAWQNGIVIFALDASVEAVLTF